MQCVCLPLSTTTTTPTATPSQPPARFPISSFLWWWGGGGGEEEGVISDTRIGSMYRPFPRARREFGTSIAPCRVVRLSLLFNRGECTVISLDEH